MKVALIGLMQCGKSTILSAISGKAAGVGGDTHIQEAVVAVPDERLDWLGKLYKPKKTVHATIDCLDLPGLSFADEHTRAAARRLFEQIRTVEVLVIVVGAYNEDSGGSDAGAAYIYRKEYCY